MSRIAIDCDGVLADFAGAFVDLAHRLWPEKPFSVAAWTDWGYGGQITKPEINKAWKAIKHTDNFWLSLNALPGVGELAYWLVGQRDHDIWICTSRSQTAGMTTTKQTEVWLASCGLRGINNFLGIVTIPNSGDKADFYKAARIEWSLDDKTETVIDCGLIDTFEHKAWLLNQPWNASDGVHNWVGSVGEFLRKIG